MATNPAISKRPLGSTGRSVTAIGLGAMPLSLAGRPDARAATNVIARFVELGGDFIDTANVYCVDSADMGHNERLIGAALRGIGAVEQVLVATKGGLTKEGSGWDADGRPEWIRQSCERSLRDLGVEQIFLYQLHAPDSAVPFEKTMGELARLREEGKVRHVGLSNVSAGEIKKAMDIVPIVSVQNRLHIALRNTLHNGVSDLCRQQNIALIAHSPVGGHGAHRDLMRSGILKQVASRHAATTYQVALAWLLQQGEHLFPIPGASRESSVESSMAAMALRLDESDLRSLEVLNRR